MRKGNYLKDSEPPGKELNRREFIGLMGAATAAALMPGSARAAYELPSADFADWQRHLMEPGASRRYFSNTHTDARMHLGGIGTGNFEIGADGQLTSWQLFNTLRDGHAPFYFAVKAGDATRLLQTAGGPDWPRITRIEMTGDYPRATLRFEDDALPVKLELEAFTPWKPLDADASSLPLAVFNFRAHNPTDQPQTVSLAALLANPVGYSAIGEIQNGAHPSVGWNVNESFQEGRAAGLYLRAKNGDEPSLDRPVFLYVLKDWFVQPPDPTVGNTNYAYVTLRDIAMPPLDRPAGLTVKIIDPAHFPADVLENPSQTVIWLNAVTPDFMSSALLPSLRECAQRGAVLVFSGKELPFAPGQPPGALFRDSEPHFDHEESPDQSAPSRFSAPLGKGRVVLWAGEILDAAQTDSTAVRQDAYAALCKLAGANYTRTEGQSALAPGFGALAVAALAGKITGIASFDGWEGAWKQFSEHGEFSPLEPGQASAPTPRGRTSNGALAATLVVLPGQTVEAPFLLSWRYPNKYNAAGAWMGCYYATRWPDIETLNRDVISRYDAVRRETSLFQQSFFGGSLPWWLLDCLTANAAIIRHVGVLFRIANGDVYAWEGSNGSCQPTCTHVWGYEQSLGRLFPDLEREMRRIDFTHQQEEGGGIHNRTDVPSPPHPTGERPFTDGHASCVLKAYREALNCDDESFFRDYWPRVKRAVEYLIDRDAKSADGQPQGILQDEQWNTYDEALHGVTTFLSGYYLAALRAGEEWARRMDDAATAERFHEIFLRGQKKLVELCWNGEYFQQYLLDYQQRQGEVGPGCMSDQLIGQWWAYQLDLGYILPREMVVSSLRSIYKYNFKSDLTGWKHAPRAYAGANDKGLIICTWPKGGRPPKVMLYSDEVWTGVEYEVAAQLIYEGLVEEGLSVAKAGRDRYDGIPRAPITRNPWCEIECGGHYTRAMSSWSLLLALSGFHCDGPKGALRFAPRLNAHAFQSFFCAPAAWGVFAQDSRSATIAVASGKLSLSTLELAFANPANVTATIAGQEKSVTFRQDGKNIKIDFGKVIINAGEKLTVECV
jgi:uncharacterized protein (DUF608 family)